MINDRYSIINKIGEGRAKVFSCSDKFNPESKFAIKILSYTSNDDELQAFDAEYELLRKFDHPNIITVFAKSKILTLDSFEKTEFHISENDKFFVMEYVDGVNIDQFQDLKSESVLLQVLDQLSSALYYLHQANYVYFDIKPENILIVKDDDKPILKLIDFGLSSYLPELKDDFAKGTAEFIAPEILNKENPDHRVDLYSLGILLYKIAYGKFPFDTTGELEIYHAHLQKKFDYPACRYSHKVVSVIQKLLEKQPENRYQSALEFYGDLERDIAYQSKINFRPLFQYIPRNDLFKKVDVFCSPMHSSNILILSGENGSGKSEVLQYIHRLKSDTVLIDISSFIRSTSFWKQFFNRLIYSDFLYNHIDESLEHYISLHIDDNASNLPTELKTIIAKISKKSKFVLLIDDIGNTSPRILEIFNELFPILQANNIKIIVTKNNDSDELFKQLENKSEISIDAFSEEEIVQLIDSSYQSSFPKEELKNLVLSYSDRHPKNIANFIFNMIISGVIDYTYKGVEINTEPDVLNKTLESQDLIYEKMYNDLLQNELIVLEIISLFKGEISVEIVTKVLGTSKKNIYSIITSLRSKNVIKSAARNLDPVFTNDGFKKYVYQKIKDKKALHLKTAQAIKENSLELNTVVFAEQFELADRYDLAKEVIDETIGNPQVTIFPKSLIELLERKLSYKLTLDEEIETLKKLISVFVDISEYLLAEKYLKKLEKKKLDENSAMQKDKLLGITLINLGELSKGLKILKTISDRIEDERNKILFEMASAHLELGDFEETENLCEDIINNETNDHELLGRVYNLMGLSALYQGSELDKVMSHFTSAFNEYNKINNLLRLASIEVNIGNISYLMGNFSESEKYWNKALQINQSIGNVSQEAQILLNYGVFNYERAKYEDAVDLYQQANAIFKGLGDKKNHGLVLTNLGETYLAICEYQHSYDSLNESQKIFKKIKNEIELSEALMLLAKLYWIIGNKTLLNEVLQKITKLNVNKDENMSVQFSFMKRISSSVSKLNKKDYSAFTKIIEDSKSINLKRVAFDIQFIIMNLLLDNEVVDRVEELIEESELLEFCKNNPHFDAKRQIILFKLSTLKNDENNGLEKPIVYLKRALEILESQSITEDTILILYNLAIYYKERGNIYKAIEYADLYFSILEYVIDNIKTRKLKDSYTENPRIKNYLFSYKNLKY